MSQRRCRRNRKLLQQQNCICCNMIGTNGHHYPRRRRNAGDGLLEMVPLCWRCHRLFHDGDHVVKHRVEERSTGWFEKAIRYISHGFYPGPEFRVREFLEATERSEEEIATILEEARQHKHYD